MQYLNYVLFTQKGALVNLEHGVQLLLTQNEHNCFVTLICLKHFSKPRMRNIFFTLSDNARKIGKNGEPWHIYVTEWVSLGTVFFRTALPCSGGYHLERGWMALHDAVGINCKKGTNWKSRLRSQVYGLRGVSWLLCVCVLSDLTWLPLLDGGRKWWYIIIITKILLYFLT